MGSRPSVAVSVGQSAIVAAAAAVAPATGTTNTAATASTASAAAAAATAAASLAESPSSSLSSSLPHAAPQSPTIPLPLSAVDIAAAALRAAASSSPDCLPSPNSVVLPAANSAATARRSAAVIALDTDDVGGAADVAGNGGSGGGSAGGALSGVTPPSLSSSVSVLSSSHRAVFSALPPIVSPSSATIPISFSPVLQSDRSLSINMRRGSSMQSQSPLSPPTIRLQTSSSHPSSASSSSLSPSGPQPTLSLFPSSSSPLSAPLASPSAGPSSFPSLLSSGALSPIAQPSTVLTTFAAPSVHSTPAAASANKERSVAVSGASRLIPRIFTGGRRKADKSSSTPTSAQTSATSEQDGEQAKESEETKELSASEGPATAAIQAIRGKVKSNSIVPQPISPQPRQSPNSAGRSAAVLEWKEGSPSVLPALPTVPSASLEPFAPTNVPVAFGSVPLSASAGFSLPSAPPTAESLPPLRSHHSVGSASLSRPPHNFLSASSDSPVPPATTASTAVSVSSASTASSASSTASESHNAPPPSLPARLAPHIFLTSSSSSAPTTERNATLAVPSPVSLSPSPSLHSSSPSPSASSISKSSHRTSIAQYIDYERRHAAEAQYHLHRKRQHQLRLQQSKQPGGVPDELQSLSVVYLPRGGIYVHTPAGPVQFGMPPETIKDSMSLGLTLPAFFVVPKERFNLAAGINVAEFGVPRVLQLLLQAAPHQPHHDAQRGASHSNCVPARPCWAPSQVDWPAEYGESVPKRCYPDLRKEMAHFSINPFDKSPLTVDSLLAFTHFDDSGRVQLEQGVAIQDAGEEYVVTVGVKQEDGGVVEREIARVRQEVFSTPLLDERDKDRAAAAAASQQQGGSSKAEPDSVEYFVPPQFGLTMLGNSDGFDSTGTTTGFVLWMNRRGIMVDPPPHSGALLKRHGISARLMRGVILTHCFCESDTRVLTNRGFLFLDEIEELVEAGREVLFGCYDVASKRLLYSKGQLVLPEQPPSHLVEFTSEGEEERWGEGSEQYERNKSENEEDWTDSRHVSLRVTPGHRMFVQTGNDSVCGPGEEEPHRVEEARKLLSTDPRASVRMLACAQSGYWPQSTTRCQAVQTELKLTDAQWPAFLELFGFWLGAGSMSYSSRSGGYNAAAFCQLRLTDRAWLKDTLERLGLRPDIDWKLHTSGATEHVYIIKLAWFCFFDKEFGSSHYWPPTSATYQQLAIDPPASVTRSLPSTPTSTSASPRSISLTSTTRGRSTSAVLTDSIRDEHEEEPSSLPCGGMDSRSEEQRSGVWRCVVGTVDVLVADSKSAVPLLESDVDDDPAPDECQQPVHTDDDKPLPPLPAFVPEPIKSFKWLPDWALLELTAAEMRLLIEGLTRAGGTFAHGGRDIYTTGVRFRDQLMQALFQCGYSPHCSLTCPAGGIQGYSHYDPAQGSSLHTAQFVQALTEKQRCRYLPVTSAADLWHVSWTQVSTDSGAGSCQPSMSRAQCVKRVPYNAERDKRIWCVQIEHKDHLIVAQRAERNAHGIVTKQSRPIITGNCHADHDAGTFQKILEEGKVVLMTTEVILDSFIRKYSAISGLDAQFLRKLFVFRPVLAGQRTAVYGGHVEFFYSLHSIPCVGFSAYCHGRSFVYSADSFNDPAGIRSLHEKGYVSEGRRDKLIHFPWHHDLILHEAGVPPIHTPLATLEALPDDVKQRLYIVHKPSKDVPTDKGLKSALVGPQNTLVISTDVPPNGRALEVLDLLSGIELFSGFDLSRALEILQCASFVECNKGDTLIAEGTYGNAGGPPCMYVIAMGTVAVEQDGQHIKQLTVGDHFGEMSIITGEKRTASVKALTPVEVIQFSKQEFLYIVRHTDAISRLQQLGVIQRSPSWQAISANSALSQLSSAQKTYLQSLFVHRLVEQGDTVWQAADPATEAVLIADGQFYFSRAKDQPPFTRGALVGEMRALIGSSTLSTTLQCAESGSVFAITRPQLCKFFDDNPGVQILFMNRRFIE